VLQLAGRGRSARSTQRGKEEVEYDRDPHWEDSLGASGQMRQEERRAGSLYAFWNCWLTAAMAGGRSGAGMRSGSSGQ
jgi:hypothetical protein